MSAANSPPGNATARICQHVSVGVLLTDKQELTVIDSNSILLFVADAPKSASFYARLLALDAVEASPTFAMFILPSGLALGLWGKKGVGKRQLPRAAAATSVSRSRQQTWSIRFTPNGKARARPSFCRRPTSIPAVALSRRIPTGIACASITWRKAETCPATGSQWHRQTMYASGGRRVSCRFVTERPLRLGGARLVTA